MIGDSVTCGGQITKVTSNNRLLQAKTLQELTATNTEATYRWITYTVNARTLFIHNFTCKDTDARSKCRSNDSLIWIEHAYQKAGKPTFVAMRNFATCRRQPSFYPPASCPNYSETWESDPWHSLPVTKLKYTIATSRTKSPATLRCIILNALNVERWRLPVTRPTMGITCFLFFLLEDDIDPWPPHRPDHRMASIHLPCAV